MEAFLHLFPILISGDLEAVGQFMLTHFLAFKQRIASSGDSAVFEMRACVLREHQNKMKFMRCSQLFQAFSTYQLVTDLSWCYGFGYP